LFIESSFLKFHHRAQQASVFILHSCGFHSAMSELGTVPIFFCFFHYK
jgi:short subunit dehydrogenase-like uncharacterized protein